MTEVQGWNSTNPTFADIIAEVKPRVIIEVGSWRGASVIHMASLCDAKFYCVDTWLGSFEHIRDGWIQFGGRPNLYEQFLENTAHLHDRMVPICLPSNIAAKCFAHKNVTADLVYIDGSHDYEDVKRDLRDYWPLVTNGGAMFGDDYWEWSDVRKAVGEFGESIGKVPAIHHDKFWSFKK